MGAADLSPREVAGSVAAHLGLGTSPLRPLPDSVVWSLRLPRVLLAAAVGAALALCGCVLQAPTRNVLADPYPLGISSGASTGAVAVIVLGVGTGVVGLAGGAFAGGLAAFALVTALAATGRAASASTTRVVLTGVAVGQLFSALTSLTVLAAGDAESLRGLTYWLLGSLTGARWASVGMTAAALGVPVGPTRVLLLVTTALVTAAAVAASGAIGFVGLVLPHVVRRLVWAHALARTAAAPQEIPVGVVTALVSAPLLAGPTARVQADGLSWSVQARVILDAVTPSAAPGELVGLLGPNGSGKSWLLRAVAGVRRVDAGTVLLDGEDVAALGRRAVARRVALVEQESSTEVDLRVRDVVDLGRIPHRDRWAAAGPDDDDATATAMTRVGVAHLAHRRWSTLSGGERRRDLRGRAARPAPGRAPLRPAGGGGRRAGGGQRRSGAGAHRGAGRARLRRVGLIARHAAGAGESDRRSGRAGLPPPGACAPTGRGSAAGRAPGLPGRPSRPRRRRRTG